MAIFNRILDFFNGDMGPVEQPRFQIPMSQPYVDDMFDPLFNRKVVEYNRDLYGTLGAIPAGYAQMWENALTGGEGILGPGMGLLSTFGRSMDKADDFILGGLTEGVNAMGRFVGTNDAPTNPIRNIFVEDQDYEGSDLLAAMGNAMGKLAGGAKLDRSDFQTLPDRLQSSVVNLATDPGFAGGHIARENPANRMAAALDAYDNAMAKAAGNVAFPGFQAMVSTARDKLNLALGTTNPRPIEDVVIYSKSDALPPVAYSMAKDLNTLSGTDLTKNPELAASLREIKRRVDLAYPPEEIDRMAEVEADMAEETARQANLQTLDEAVQQVAKGDMQTFTNLMNSGKVAVRNPSEIVYTDSSAYKDWIKDLIRRESPDDGIDDETLDANLDEYIDMYEPNAWDEIEFLMRQSEMENGKTGTALEDAVASSLDYYRQFGLEEGWNRWMRDSGRRVSDLSPSPVYFKTSGLGYQKRIMPQINRNLAAADATLFRKSPYVRNGARLNAVRPKSVVARLEQIVGGISRYLNANDPYKKDAAENVWLPGEFKYIQKNLDKLKKGMSEGTSDAYSVMKMQFDLANAIMSNPKYFNDVDAVPFVNWANDVMDIANKASGKMLDDVNARVKTTSVSFSEEFGKGISESYGEGGWETSYDTFDKGQHTSAREPFSMRVDYEKPYRDSVPYAINSTLYIKPDDIKTVKQWQKYTKGLPDTIDIALKPGASLTADAKFLNSNAVSNPAKTLALFSKLPYKMETVPVKVGWDSAAKKPIIENRPFKVFEVDKSLFKNPAFQDNPFLYNFMILNRVKKGGSGMFTYDRQGEYLRLSTKAYGLTDIDKMPGAKIRLAYDPSGFDYLSEIKYDEATNKYIVSGQHALEMFSTRKPYELSRKTAEVQGKFIKPATYSRDAIRKQTYENLAAHYLKDSDILKSTNIFKDASPEVVAKFVADPGSLATMETDEMKRVFLGDFLERCRMPSDASHEEIAKAVDEFGSPDDKRLYAMLDAVADTEGCIRIKDPRYGIRGSEEARAAMANAIRLKTEATGPSGYDGTRFKKAQRFRWEHEDQIIPGDSFLDYIRRTPSGIVRIGLSDGNAVRYDAIKGALTRNVNAINEASKRGNVLRVKEFEHNGSKFIEVGVDYDNPNVKLAAKTYLGGLFPKNLDLEDVVVQKASTLPEDPDIKEYTDLFNQIESVMQPVYVRMGGAAPQADWMMHVVTDDPIGCKVFTDIDAASGTSVAKSRRALNDFSKIVGAPSIRGKVGVSDYRRSYLGDYDAYEGGFTDDPQALAEHSFSDGVANSVYANSIHEFFYNKQFRINQWFSSPDRLAAAFRAYDAEGNRAGNLSGLVLATPTFDENGVLTGIRRYNPLSDDDIAKAFADPNAVVLPNNAIVSIERLLKKDKRLMYKPTTLGRLANYFHHYVSVPIKFGILSNMGFLAGNVQDAYFKQAETMAKAYGTTIDEELANVGMAYKVTMDLKNDFSDVYKMYLSALLDEDAINRMTGSAEETRRQFGNTIAMAKQAKKLGTEIDPAEVMNNPRYFKEWIDFVSHPRNEWLKADSHELNVAKVYTFLQVRQNTATFENNTLDLADIYDAERQSEFDKPENLLDRVLYGDPSSEVFTYGLMLNNPFSNFILRKSNSFESFTRTASVINAMMHQGWDLDRIANTLGKSSDEYKSAMEKLRVDSYNAINLMHHSNFDYENVTDFMDNAGKIMPFPTFYLKNVSHWADTFADHPEMLDDIISFHEGLWQNKDTSDDEFAAQAKGRGAYPLGGRTKFGTGIVKPTPINSMFSAFSAVNNLKEDLAFRLHPAMRPLTRHLQKPEDVKYRPYSMNPYERNIKKGDPNFSDLAYMFHQLNPYERFVNTYSRTPKKVATNDYQASDFLPSIFQPDFGKKRR